MTTDHDDSFPRSFFSLRRRPEPDIDAAGGDYREPLTPPRPMPVRPRSDAVARLEAEAASRWEALEQELSYERQSSEQLRAENAVFKVAIEKRNEELQLLKKDNERLVRENTSVHERVKIAAEVLVGLQKPMLSEASSFDERHEPAINIPDVRDKHATPIGKAPINWPKPPSKEKSDV